MWMMKAVSTSRITISKSSLRVMSQKGQDTLWEGHLGWDQDTLICSPICACCLTLGSGPDEKVASDFTSVPDPSARRFPRGDHGDRFMIARAERLTRPVPLIPMCDSLLIGWRFVTKWVAICGYLVAVCEKYLAQISKTNDIWHESCYIYLVIRWLWNFELT